MQNEIHDATAYQSVRYKGRALSGPSRWLVAGIFILLSYTAWARGGTAAINQAPLTGVSALLLVILLMTLRFRSDNKGPETSDFSPLKRLLGDPVLYAGVSFLSLLFLQWWNSGRQLVFDTAQGRWFYTSPPVAWLPFAFSRPEAAEMLVWFSGALVLMLSLRSPWFTRHSAYVLWRLMVLNGALLALFGIVQYLSGTSSIFWTTPLPYQRFFASFGYSNHAGSFFLLMVCLAGGMWIRDILKKEVLQFNGWTLFWIITVLLNLSGACLSFSRAATLMVSGTVVLLTSYALFRLWRRIGPADRINVVMVLACVFTLAIVSLAAIAGSWIVYEMGKIREVPANLLSTEDRWLPVGAALKIWADYPLFGVGGWGFRYLVAMYLPPGKSYILAPGLANVHNDVVQFLAEFGVLGSGLILTAIFAIMKQIRPADLWRRPALLFGAIGVALVWVQSLVDLPFRCPAVMYSWIAIVAGIARLCSDGMPGRAGGETAVSTFEQTKGAIRKP